jgi:hypothetical protein
MRFISALAFSSLAACAVDKAPPTDDFSDLASLDQKADAFSYRMKILGSLDYGQTSDAVKYTKTPRFRAFKFAGNQGDMLDIWVRSPDGDAVAWVLDNSFKVIDTNDDGDETTLDAHIHVQLAASTSATHYVVFRDYGMHAAHFTVELTGTAATNNTCSVDADCAAVVSPDDRVPQCNTVTSQCELVAPGDIRCNGFTRNPHTCAPGYTCKLNPIPDIPGTCERVCIQRVFCTTTSHWDSTQCACVAN